MNINTVPPTSSTPGIPVGFSPPRSQQTHTVSVLTPSAYLTVQFLVPIHLELSSSDPWYPPRPYHRPSLGTHQSRHLPRLGSTPLTPPSDPLSNSPPTLSWYPPLLLLTSDSSTSHPSVVLVKPESGYLHHDFPPLVMMSFWTPVEFRRCSFKRHADDSHLPRRMYDRDPPPSILPLPL